MWPDFVNTAAHITLFFLMYRLLHMWFLKDTEFGKAGSFLFR